MTYEDGTECSETSKIQFRRRGIAQNQEYNPKFIALLITARHILLTPNDTSLLPFSIHFNIIPPSETRSSK
jgi:hypothetical protein